MKKYYIPWVIVAFIVHASALPVARAQGFPNNEYSPAEVGTWFAEIDAEGDPDGDGGFGILPQDGSTVMGINQVLFHKGYMIAPIARNAASRGTGMRRNAMASFDISDLSNIKRTFFQQDDVTNEIREAHGLVVSSGDILCINTIEGVQFWNVADPTNMVLLSNLHLPGMTTGTYGKTGWWVMGQHPYYYLGSTQMGLHIIKASNPSNPVLIRQKSARNLGLSSVGSVHCIGNLMILGSAGSSDSTSGPFSTIDISDPENPQLLDRGVGSGNYSVGVYGHYITTQGPGGLKVWDMTDPTDVKEVFHNPSITEANYSCFADNYYHLPYYRTYRKYDFPFPAEPLLVSSGIAPIEKVHEFTEKMGNLIIGTGGGLGDGAKFIPFQTAPDTQAPEVNFVNPRNLATQQALGSRIGLIVTDTLDFDSVNTSTFIVREVGGGKLNGKFSYSRNYLNFIPSEPLKQDKTYEIIIPEGGIKDIVGNGIVRFESRFSTGPNVQLSQDPGVVITSPAKGGTVTDPVSLAFSVINFPLGSGGRSLAWFIDGIAGGTTADISPIAVGGLDDGPHTIRIALMQNGLEIGISDSATFTVDRLSANLPPRITLVAPTIVLPGSLVSLDASQSYDPDQGPDPLAFHWELLGGPAAVTFDPGTSANPSVRLTGAGEYKFRLTLGDGHLSAVRNFTITAREVPRKILFVTNSGSFLGGDLAIHNYLTARGWGVVGSTAQAVTRETAELYGMVLVSGTISSANFNRELVSAAVPVLVWESHVLDDLGMTGRSDISDYGSTNLTKAVITDPSNPLSTGLPPGEVGVFTKSSKVAWGRPGPNAVVGASTTSGQALVFGYDEGAAMVSEIAPARRIAIMPGETAFSLLTPAGLTLFNNAIDWAVGTTVADPQPAIIITSPAQDAVLTADFALVFSVANFSLGTDGRSLAWFLDGLQAGSKTNSSPISFSGLTSGSHTLRIELLKDGTAIGEADSLTFTVVVPQPPANLAPTITLVAPATVPLGGSVLLDASQSSDSDNGPAPLEFRWELLAGPAPVSFDAGTAPSTSVALPVAGPYDFRVTLGDGHLSAFKDFRITAEVVPVPQPSVTITSPASGSSLTTNFPLAFSVTGFALGSNNRSLAWYLDGNQQGTTTSTSPIAVSSLTAGLHTLRIDLLQNGTSIGVSDSVTITVDPPPANLPPRITLVAPATVLSGHSVTLDASLSSDPDSGPGPLTFQWDLIEGPAAVSFTPPTASTTTAVISAAGDYNFRLTVSDGNLSDFSDFRISAHAVPKEVLMVTHTGGYSGDDVNVRNHLISQGLVVSVTKAQSATKALAERYGLVLVSATINSKYLHPDLAGASVPVVNWESHVLDDLGMTGPKENTDYAKTLITKAVIPNSFNTLTAGLAAGEVAIYSTPSEAPWGRPGPNAIVGAATASGQALVFGYDKGAAMASRAAPERRVSVMLGETSFSALTPAGLALFNNALNWALGTTPIEPQPMVTIISPAEGAAVPADIPLVFSVTDFALGSDGRSVAWSVNGLPAGTKTNSSPIPIIGLTPGSHTVKVDLLQNGAPIGVSDSVTFTMEPPPTPNLAPSITLVAPLSVMAGGSVTLDASQSSDPDQGPGPLTFHWELLEGPAAVTFAEGGAAATSVVLSAAGQYEFRLTLSDGDLSAVSVFSISALAPAPEPSVMITSPIEAGTLTPGFPLTFSVSHFALGSGGRSLAWSIDGVTRGTTTSISPIPMGNLAAGSHTVRVELLQDGTAIGASDSVAFTILPPPANLAPTITLVVPTTVQAGASAALDASQSSDPDGGPASLSFLWELIDGPTVVSFSSGTGSATSAVLAAAGDYDFRLTIGDGELIATAEFRISAVAGSEPGQQPAITITSPTDGGNVASGFPLVFSLANFELGSGGRSLAWSIDGIQRGTAITDSPISISGLTAGPHTLRIDLLQNGLTTGISDSVTFTMEPPPPPANRAPHITLVAPTIATAGGSVVLNGSQTSDPDHGPTPLTFRWDLIGGPAPVSFSPPTASTTTAVLSAAGDYDFRLTVTDGNLSDSADFRISARAGSKEVLMVTHTGGFSGSDVKVRDHLISQGLTVAVTKAQSVTRSLAGRYGLVLVSATINSKYLHPDLAGAPVPVMNWESHVLDDLGMTGNKENTDYAKALLTKATIPDGSNSLAGGLAAGEVAIYNTPTEAPWGRPGPYAMVGAVSSTGQALVFGYEMGAQMVGRAAPARRVSVMLGEHSFSALTPAGLSLFDSALNWALGTVNPEPVTLEISENIDFDPLAASPDPVSLKASIVGGVGVVEYSWEIIGADGLSVQTPWSASNLLTRTFPVAGNHVVILRVRDTERTQTRIVRLIVHTPVNLGKASSSSGIALVKSGRKTLWNVNPDNNSVTVLDAVTLDVIAEIPVAEDPRTLAAVGSSEVWVASHDDPAVTILSQSSRAPLARLDLPRGSAPEGLVVDGNGAYVYVALRGSGGIARINVATRKIVSILDVPSTPKGLALDPSGDRLYVTQFISPDDAGKVTEIDLPTYQISSTIDLGISHRPDTIASGRGLPNYLSHPAISPDGSSLLIPSKQDNILRGTARDGNPLTSENTVRAIVSKVDLKSKLEVHESRWDLNDSDSPNAIAFSPLGNLVFVSVQGTNTVMILDAYNRGEVSRFPVGAAPDALVMDRDSGILYVHHFLDRSVAAYDTNDLSNLRSDMPRLIGTRKVVANENLSAQVLLGKKVFYNAGDPRMSADGYISCATCHLDGDSDGRVWDFTDRGEGLRNTTDLRGRAGTGHGPVHWSANFDEIQDFENDIRMHFSGLGFMADGDFEERSDPLGAPKAGLSVELDALAAYVTSLDRVPDSPNRDADGSMTAEAVAGREVFVRLDCASCHSGDDFTDSSSRLLHDVGTLKTTSGQRVGGLLPGIDTPTLKGVWATAPYFHDGSAQTLRDVIDASGPLHGNMDSLAEVEKSQIIAYLQQLGAPDVNPGRRPGYQISVLSQPAIAEFQAPPARVFMAASELTPRVRPPLENVGTAVVSAFNGEPAYFEVRVRRRKDVAWGDTFVETSLDCKSWKAEAAREMMRDGSGAEFDLVGYQVPTKGRQALFVRIRVVKKSNSPGSLTGQ